MRLSLAQGKYKWDGNQVRRNLAFWRSRKEAGTVLWRARTCDKIRNLHRIENLCAISFSRKPYCVCVC